MRQSHFHGWNPFCIPKHSSGSKPTFVNQRERGPMQAMLCPTGLCCKCDSGFYALPTVPLITGGKVGRELEKTWMYLNAGSLFFFTIWLPLTVTERTAEAWSFVPDHTSGRILECKILSEKAQTMLVRHKWRPSEFSGHPCWLYKKDTNIWYLASVHKEVGQC